jgi:hypothetical protein
MGSGWLKLAIFAFVGILIIVVVLGMTSSSGLANSEGSHTQHQQATVNTNGMSTQSMSINGSMSNNGMTLQDTDAYGNAQMQNILPNNSMLMNNNFYLMQQQMMQMQNQLNMMQQQLTMMNNQSINSSNNVQQSSMSAGGSTQMQGGMGGMM